MHEVVCFGGADRQILRSGTNHFIFLSTRRKARVNIELFALSLLTPANICYYELLGAADQRCVVGEGSYFSFIAPSGRSVAAGKCRWGLYVPV